MHIPVLLESALQSAERTPLPWLWWFAPIGAVIALVTAFLFYRSVMKETEGTDEMIRIAQAVRDGAQAYLRRQNRIILIVFAVLFVVFLAMAFVGLQNPVIPFAFLTGGLFSGLAGYIGMRTATNASARTANAASNSLNAGLQVALRAGAVLGLTVVGFALIDITFWFLMLYFGFPALLPNSPIATAANPLPIITATMLGGAMGASLQALFARVGGGIYTKAADVGADLAGKVEEGLDEDDPRNPAVIADNVGDNVGDVAGMGADLYESYFGSILATSALGVSAVAIAGTEFYGSVGEQAMQLNYIALPVATAAIGVLLSILGVFIVRAKDDATQEELINALSMGHYVSAAGVAVVTLGLVLVLGLPNGIPIWVAIVSGLLVGIIIGKMTEYYTSHAFKPTRGIAEQGETSPATVIIEGLAVGMESVGVPVIAIAMGIAVSFFSVGGAANTLMGLYGVGIAAVAMLSTLGFTLATDAYGPIADNAGGNAEMAGLDSSVREKTDALDAVGNTTAASGKGFAIGSAALTALALLAAYIEQIRQSLATLVGVETLDVAGEAVEIGLMTMEDFVTFYEVTLLNPSVLIGLFAGSATAFYFSALTMRAVGRAAGGMVDEVRRQLNEIPGLREGTAEPDYARCVEISTAAAQREMVVPAVLAVSVPVIIGVVFGVAGVLGLLAGGLSTGFALAVMMANAGGAWDNAKKYVETGAHGGKNSEAHKATVVGDTVGDPFKDTSGPSLNILIKLMSMVSVVFAGLIAAIGNGTGLLAMFIGG